MTDDGLVEGGLDDPTELEPEQGTLDLVQAEDSHTRADWEEATAAVLRKAGRMSDDDADALVWDKLTITTLDGVALPPLGIPEMLDDLQTSGRPTREGEWDIRSFLPAGDAKTLQEEAMVDLNGGVTSLWVQAAPDTEFAALLDGVHLDLAPLVLDAPAESVATAWAFLKHAEDLELHPGTNLGVSVSAAGSSSDRSEWADVATLAKEHGIRAFVVDATTVHDRGASEAQELGYATALGASYLRTLTEVGVSVDDAASLVEFRLAVTDEQFTMIAKLRAARRLWARVLELSGVSTGSTTEGSAMAQHAVTSRPMMASRDPWVNMLRTTVAAFAAGVGGADAVTVLPFDSPLGRPDALGRRVARNTSALLISEAHVARVTDPAGGSYAVEKLTDDLAAAGWAELGRIEDDGFEALEGRIADVAAAREKQVATRKRPLTGVTEFPNLAETLPERPGYDAWEGVRAYGASFEALRADAPTAHVFLATLGSVAAHTARASFTTNLLAAGGIAVDVAGATADVEALVEAYDGQLAVCLAGPDSAYADWGEAAATALREAGAKHVVIAGKQTDYADDACARGVDALDFLTRTREKLT